jgi:hypothetical protein
VLSDAFSRRLVVKHSPAPLSTKLLLNAVEDNQLTIMFRERGHLTEQIFRNSTGTELYRFENIIEMYSPTYASDFTDDVDSTYCGHKVNILFLIF